MNKFVIENGYTHLYSLENYKSFRYYEVKGYRLKTSSSGFTVFKREISGRILPPSDNNEFNFHYRQFNLTLGSNRD